MPKTKEEQLIAWKDKIKLGILYQSHYGHTQRWPLYERYFEGDWPQNVLPVNLIFAFGKSLIPRVYSRNPRAVMTSLIPGKYLHAKTVQKLVNWLTYETGVKKQMKRMCQDSYLYGTAIGKCGYDSEYGYDISKSVPIIPGQGTLTGFGKDEENIEYRVNVKPGMPWFLRGKAIDFILPYGYLDIESAPWCAMRVMRPLEDVIADKKYINKKELKGGKGFVSKQLIASRPTDVEGSVPDKMLDVLCEKEEWVELYEIRDFRTHRVYVITMDHDKFLREDVDDLQVEGLPYFSLIFNESNLGFWGISDCQIIEPQQLEMNEIRTQAQRHRKVALIKALVRRGVMSADEKQKFLSNEVMSFVEIDTDEPLQAVIDFVTPHVPPDFVPMSLQIMQDCMEMLGSSRNQRGDYMTGRRTATEAQIVQLAAQIRIMERRDAAADLYTNICRKYMQYIFTFWRDKNKVIDIVGVDGARYWVQYTGAAIKGEYNIRVDPDDSLPVTFETRLMEAKELYGMTLQDPTINRIEMSRQLLQQYEWIDPDVLLAPRPGWGNNPEQPMPIDALQRLLATGGMNANIPS
jgi:hypothetical protein